MANGYDIIGTQKDENNVITHVTTDSGVVKTKQEVVSDIANGYNITSEGTKVISVEDKYIRTVPNEKESDNLSNK